MNALLIAMILAASLMSGYITSEGKDSSGYGVGSNDTESTSTTESPMLGSGVGRDSIFGSGG